MMPTRVSPGEIRAALMRRYDRCVMNNTERGLYVECMVALALGDDWELAGDKAWIEVQQSAARKPGDRQAPSPYRNPSFYIFPRKGPFIKAGGRWVRTPARRADIYIFAWHDEKRSEHADHRDPDQWLFYVAPEKYLPDNKGKIRLTELEKIFPSHSIAPLKHAVENALPPQEALKDTP